MNILFLLSVLTGITESDKLLDFIGTIISVIIGGLITYAAIIFEGRRNKRKEIKNKKLAIYYGFHVVIRAYVRNLTHYLKFHATMYYHKQKYQLQEDFSEKFNTDREEYLLIQGQLFNFLQLRSEAANLIDDYTLKYTSFVQNDKQFEKLLNEFRYSRKPVVNVFNEINNTTLLDKTFEEKLKEVKTFRKSLFNEKQVRLISHIKYKLKIKESVSK